MLNMIYCKNTTKLIFVLSFDYLYKKYQKAIDGNKDIAKKGGDRACLTLVNFSYSSNSGRCLWIRAQKARPSLKLQPTTQTMQCKTPTTEQKEMNQIGMQIQESTIWGTV